MLPHPNLAFPRITGDLQMVKGQTDAGELINWGRVWKVLACGRSWPSELITGSGPSRRSAINLSVSLLGDPQEEKPKTEPQKKRFFCYLNVVQN